MQKFNGSLLRQFPSLTTGNAASGVQVSVFVSGTNTLATLYSTNAISAAQLENPLTTDGKGFYSFYAEDNRYRLEFNNGYPSLEIQLVDVIDINTEFNAAISGLENTVDTLTLTVAGDFDAGANVTARNQVVLWPVSAGGDGREYRWAGALPKTVPPASTPAGTGGISDSAWVYAADVAFEQALAAADSVKLVSGVQARIIAGLTKRKAFFVDNYITNFADSQAGIAQAVDDAFNVGGGDLFFTGRDYGIVQILLKKNVVLRGVKGSTRLYYSSLPTGSTQGMIAARLGADNCGAHGFICDGESNTGPTPALLKGIVAEECVNWHCTDCVAMDLPSYGFWSHTDSATDPSFIAKNHVWERCVSINTEHAFETKRAHNVIFRDVEAYGGTFSESAFHAWERSKNVEFYGKAYGDYNTAACFTLGSNLPGLEGNNKNIVYDVYLEVNKDGTQTKTNRAAYIYRADDIRLKLRGSSFAGVLWGGDSGDMYADIDITVNNSGFVNNFTVEPATPETVGVLYGKVRINLASYTGQNAGTPMLIGDACAGINADEITANVVYNNGEASVRTIQLVEVPSVTISKVEVQCNNNNRGLYLNACPDVSILKCKSTNLTGDNTSLYAFDNCESVTIGSLSASGIAIGVQSLVAGNATIESVDMNCRNDFILSGTSKISIGGGKVVSDATSTASNARVVDCQNSSRFKAVNLDMQLINAGSVPTTSKMLRDTATANINLSACEIYSDQAANDIQLAGVNTVITSTTLKGLNSINFNLLATANKSMLANNIIKTATVNSSTGSTVSEIVF